jgi:hypothetical protein
MLQLPDVLGLSLPTRSLARLKRRAFFLFEEEFLLLQIDVSWRQT